MFRSSYAGVGLAEQCGWQSTRMTDKPKILLLASNSLDKFYLPSGEEQRQIANALDASPNRARFNVSKEPALRLSDLGKMLMKHEPVIMHFSGDGKAGKGILLEDDKEIAMAVGAKELAGLLKELKGNLRLVVLNACYTRTHAEEISRDIDYAIGMAGKVDGETAMAFARYLYQAIGYGKTVEEAFNIAKHELLLGGYAGSKIPVLRVKPGVDSSQPLFDTQATRRSEIHESETDALMRDLGTQFVKQLSIAGHFQDAHHSQQAIYLDDNLYVHRESEEAAILKYAAQFAEMSAPQGKWVCVVGDAGHGKSSLLWYIHENLKGAARLRIVPFLAQLEGHWRRMEATVLQLKRGLPPLSKLVVIIDTLDILVGMDDAALGAMLNSLRAAGCMVLTTSRRQEAERLFRVTPSDHQVELKKFDDDEAQQAIRNYVNLAYYWWDGKDRVRQVDKIWGILEQQRNVRELDLEPLILRMFFEAYVPNEIPQDINTQQVYKKYWTERVLLDRVVKDAGERYAREQLCRLAAREIGSDSSHSDKLSVDGLHNVWKTQQSATFPHSILEGLVSTGVFQWAEGVSTIRFFHQTFFEYTAAYDLLASDEALIEKSIEKLLSEVANYRLFRAPILKQFAIQAFEIGNAYWRKVLQGLRAVNNELAAQMALEIVGKLPDDAFLLDLCREWIEKNRVKLQNVICETVRHYPRSKTVVALSLLEPYLESPKANVIYALCAETFAQDAPAQVCEFLSRHLPKIVDANDDEKTLYSQALCTTLQYGADAALDVLLNLFLHLKPGQQAGLLDKVAKVLTSANAEQVADFLKRVTHLMPRVNKDKQAEVWHGILTITYQLHEMSPSVGGEFARWLISIDQWKQNQTAARYAGMIIGPTISDPLVVYQSLAAIASTDHFTRLMNTGLLSCLPESFSSNLMDRILSLEKADYQAEAQLSSLFTIVASLKGVEPAKILQFLGEWPWQHMGVGTPLRDIIESLAEADPAITKDWLFKQLAATKGPFSPKLFSSFNILLQAKVTAFEPREVRQLYDSAFASSKTLRQIFAGTIGSIVRIDKQLADEIFKRVFSTEGKDCQVAAVNSLSHCLDMCPEFALDQAGHVLKAALSNHHMGILHSYLIVLKEFPRDRAGYLLRRLSDWFTEEILQNLRDDKTFGELLTILKIIAEADPQKTFDFSKRIPLINKGVAGGMAALYDQVSEHGEGEPFLLDVLERVAEVSKFDQVRMKNALRRTLRQLDQKLGGRKVVETIFGTYKTITDEAALKTFIEAALRVTSWTEEDTMRLLQDADLPGSVRGLLAAKIKR
jgi:hypothetical protein